MSGRAAEALRRVDAESRALAQSEFERPLVLEAGAGTGKTATLIARVLAWCLGPGWERAERAARDAAGSLPEPEAVAPAVLDGVVAITFTEAAAAEMAQRVGEGLGRVERGGAWPPGLDPGSLPADAELRVARARALLGALDHLVVRTIHAFCYRLLAIFPLEAGLPPRFEVDADGAGAREIATELLDEVLRGGGDEAAAAIVALAIDGCQPTDLREALVDLVADGVPAEAFAPDPFEPARVRRAVKELLAALHAFIARDAGRLVSVKRGNARKAASALGSCVDALERLDEDAAGNVDRVVETLGRQLADAPVKKLACWARGEWSASELEAVSPHEERLAGEARVLLDAVEALLGSEPDRVRAARRALAPLLAEMSRRLRARGLVSYQDLLHLTRELLREHPAVAARVRAGLQQLLVDEFQDTDEVQCDVVRLLALEGERCPGLFLVGDPKQSIYGWRNADLRAYHEFVERVRELGGSVHRLHVNFRSQPPILDEVERVVRPVMQRREGTQPDFEPLVASEEHAKGTGFRLGGRAPVEYWDSAGLDAAADTRLDATPAQRAARLEARALARDLRELHDEHGVPWGASAILLRSSGDLDVYLEELRHLHVPHAVSKDRSYFLRREIVEASALVRAVLDPGDRLALVALLRSSFVGVPDAALFRLWSRGLDHAMVALRDASGLPAALEHVDAVAEELPECDPPGWAHVLRSSLESLADLRARFSTDAPDAFVEELRERFLVEPTAAARYLGAYRVANLDRFFRELVEELSAEGADVHAILRRLREGVADERAAEEARPRESLEDAVQVMTMHAAKGLDFDHVYLPQLHKGPGTSSRKKARARRLGEHWEFDAFGASTLGWRAARQRDDEVAWSERVRLLYVAMTRAKSRLVLCGVLQREARRPEAATSFVELLPGRDGGFPDPSELFSGGETAKDAHGARWRAAARAPADESEPPAADADVAGLPTAADVATAATRLAVRREDAARRMARPFRGLASAAGEPAPADERHERETRERVSAGERARRIGTAVHKVLEEAGADEAAWPGAVERAARWLEWQAPGAEAAEARAELLELLEEIEAGTCLARLRALRENVLARELPVLLPPGEDGDAVGYVAGTADLVYRDPGDGAIVVADYKTDRDVSDEKIASYAAQGALYTRAIQEALGLAELPRFELWFLRADAIERC